MLNKEKREYLTHLGPATVINQEKHVVAEEI